MNQISATKSRKKPLIRVEVGQVWEVMSPRGDRFAILVEMLAGNSAICRAVSTGRNVSVPTSTLSRRRRCARLLRNADGSELAAETEAHVRPFETAAERRTASECLRTHAAKHVKAPGEETRRIYELYQQGLKYREIAEVMRSTPGTIKRRLEIWRAWLQDQHVMGAQ